VNLIFTNFKSLIVIIYIVRDFDDLKGTIMSWVMIMVKTGLRFSDWPNLYETCKVYHETNVISIFSGK